MNIKEEIGFYVKSVGKVSSTPNGNHKFMEIGLRKPAPKDEFGESYGADEIFMGKVWNKKIESLPELAENDKVMVSLAFNGHEGLSQNGEIYYALNLTIRSMRKV